MRLLSRDQPRADFATIGAYSCLWRVPLESITHSSHLWLTCEPNAICAPLGDHSGNRSCTSRLVSRRWLRPLASVTYISQLPSRLDASAICAELRPREVEARV